MIDDEPTMVAIAKAAKRVAVLGIKTERQAGQPAFDVARGLSAMGIEIFPIPVYYPEVARILGRPVTRTVAEIDGPIDILDVFRRPADIPEHLVDIILKKPKVVWFQLGIRNDEAASALVEAGIDVIQDRCLWIELMKG